MTSKCSKWHQQPFINPLTNRKIKKNGPTYKELERECGPPPRRSSPRRLSSPQRRPDQRIQLYCGNNARDEGLINGTKILGTRYQCLKKGIGKGLNEPILKYNNDYEPIENVRIYCGNGALPNNKDRFGTRDECLRKGFAVGQKQKYIRDGGIQRGPIVIEENGWYKAYLPR
uniref:2-cysteine adaptor domain-containing protein n=1 Tax=Iridovirus Liz-CrIV TaxID=2594309 RepID=A0A5B8RIH4_9VIRU|nr:putative protein 378R [Iridovirus Liz-CrIV]